VTDWGDLVARSRGLSTRLLGAEAWPGLVAARDLDALKTTMRVDGGTDAQSVERAIREVGASRLTLLRGWAGTRARVLVVLFEDEDRRTIRALLRGAVANVPASLRLTGLVPTPSLPAALLRQLAEQPNAAGVASLLAARDNAYGRAVLEESLGELPHLLALEARLDATFATRATEAARDGDRDLRAFVRLLVDVQNCWSAIIVHGEQDAAVAMSLFISGGERVGRRRFERAFAASSRSDAADILAPAFGRATLGVALRDHAPPASLDGAALTTALGWARQAARRAPLGTAPIIWYVLRQRAELRAAQQLTWGLALSAPVERLVPMIA